MEQEEETEGTTELRNSVAGEKKETKNFVASRIILERSQVLGFGFEFTFFPLCDALFEKKPQPQVSDRPGYKILTHWFLPFQAFQCVYVCVYKMYRYIYKHVLYVHTYTL